MNEFNGNGNSPLGFLPKKTLIAIVTGFSTLIIGGLAWWMAWQMGQSQNAMACAKSAELKVQLVEVKLDMILKQNDEMRSLLLRHMDNRR